MKWVLTFLSVVLCFSLIFANEYGGPDNLDHVLDTYIDEANPDQQYWQGDYLVVCGHGSIKKYTLIYFAEDFSSDLNAGVFDDWDIDANLILYKQYSPLLGIRIGAVNWYGWWYDSELSWSDLPWNPDDPPEVFTFVTEDVLNIGEDVPHYLDVTPLVEYWVSNHENYYGFVIYSPISDNVSASFFSSENVEYPERAPLLVVEDGEGSIQTTSMGKIKSLFNN